MKFQLMFLAAFGLVASCGADHQMSKLTADSDNNHSDADRVYTADNCLGDQDMNLSDIDITNCPAIPSLPQEAPFGTDATQVIDLGAWELGTTSTGETYKYGSLSEPEIQPRVLKFDGEGSAAVNAENLSCWAKGYYRLRKILQDPPTEYISLRTAGFQVRFFQFQTDLRNGQTGFKEISSYRDHLVKWVTLIQEDGTCVQPTRGKFVDYAAAELRRRGLGL
jgi:hypothetical protein